MEDRGSWQATQSIGSGLHTYVVCAKWLQSCPTLCNPVDCSPPGSSVHGILQARILEWVAISSSRGSSQELNLHLISPTYTHTHTHTQMKKKMDNLQGLRCTLWVRFSENRWLGLPPLSVFPSLIPLANPASPSSDT